MELQTLYNELLESAVELYHNEEKGLQHFYTVIQPLEKIIEEYKNKLDSNKMDASDGGTLGFRRAILEDDNLANIDSLYNAAVAVDKFYSQECREW